ncbi:MAG: UDP-N-acetylmuramate dehydrogenase [Candidatus Kaiserbacteria bacterium]|nr:MAG: UDP-N-acetylmuramate dehydrogenase [Candidatus Kaiserbacteria bacterium]
MDIRENVPLAPLTTFEIGGTARFLVDVRTEEQIREAIEWARERKIGFVVLSGGSNVLLPDQGLDSLVIRFVGNLWSVQGSSVDAWAATNLLELIRAMATQALGGWEKLAGIPGGVGGAARGNAGAFGSEIKDFIVRVSALHAESGETRFFNNEECDFSYRHSFFKDHPEWIITRVVLQLQPTDRAASETLIEETIREREKRHLQNVRAAGSFFMNPVAPQEVQDLFEREKGVKSREGRVPAGWLIEKAGLKGAQVGGAIASVQHPNYIVNTGDASAEDVLELARLIKEAVLAKFGIRLEEEAALFT